MADFNKARQNMVDCQLRTNKITDPAVIDAFETMPREAFIDDNHKSVAYSDENLAIGAGRCLMEPMVLARLVQELAISSNDIVLDIGCGTGYSSAILSRLSATVVALESDASLATRATKILAELAADNAVVVDGPLIEGYPKQGPYDVICIEGAVREIPKALTDQLADGGRLAAVIDDGVGPGRAVLMLKRGSIVSKRPIFDANIPPLPEFERSAGFVF
jgi:protein-L-isoaspartate(D-aspartate) O-methyltransferase